VGSLTGNIYKPRLWKELVRDLAWYLKSGNPGLGDPNDFVAASWTWVSTPSQALIFTAGIEYLNTNIFRAAEDPWILEAHLDCSSENPHLEALSGFLKIKVIEAHGIGNWMVKPGSTGISKETATITNALYCFYSFD
jgi:hypothetical protein